MHVARVVTVAVAVLLLAETIAAADKHRHFCQRAMNATGLLPDHGVPPPECKIAVFSGGSFVQLANAFRNEKGIFAVAKGYTGGFYPNPSYRKVCKGKTGHAEAVMIAHDPSLLPASRLFKVWLNAHDPTVSGANMAIIDDATFYGSMFRSAAFIVHDEERKRVEKALRDHKERLVLDVKQRAPEGSALAEGNATADIVLATRVLRFRMRFYFESATDAELVSIRKSVPPDPSLRMLRVKPRYVRHAKGDGLVAKQQETQPVSAGDDAVLKALAELDKKGQLAAGAGNANTTAAQQPAATGNANATAAAPPANGTATAETPTVAAAAATQPSANAPTSGPAANSSAAQPVQPPPAPTSAAPAPPAEPVNATATQAVQPTAAPTPAAVTTTTAAPATTEAAIAVNNSAPSGADTTATVVIPAPPNTTAAPTQPAPTAADPIA